MPKRKREDKESETYILKKLRRLEKKLKKKRGTSRRIESSSSSSSPRLHRQSPQDMIEISPTRELTYEVTPNAVSEDIIVDVIPEQPPLASVEVPDPAVNLEDTLDEDILNLLGESPTKDKKLGPKIQKDIALRWEHIATNGLTKEVKKELIEKHLTPENCTKIDPPLLNREIKAAISEPLIKKDKSIENKQRQISAAITCLGEALTRALAHETKDHDMIKLIIEAGRLVCDNQHTESMIRRSFLCSAIKKDFKEHLYETEIDKYLFGETLSESLKSAKAMQKSSSEMKINQPSTSKNIPKKSPLNSRGTLPGNSYRQPAVTRRRQEPAPAPYQQRRRPAPPPPPPPPPPPQQRSQTRGYTRRPN